MHLSMTHGTFTSFYRAFEGNLKRSHALPSLTPGQTDSKKGALKLLKQIRLQKSSWGSPRRAQSASSEGGGRRGRDQKVWTDVSMGPAFILRLRLAIKVAERLSNFRCFKCADCNNNYNWIRKKTRLTSWMCHVDNIFYLYFLILFKVTF